MRINDSNLNTHPGLLQRSPTISKLVHSHKLCATQLQEKKERFSTKKDKNNQKGVCDIKVKTEMKSLFSPVEFWFWGHRADVGWMLDWRPP